MSYIFNNDWTREEFYDDIGQANADLIGAGLTNDIAPEAIFLSGAVKYDKIGNMVILYFDLITRQNFNNDYRIFLIESQYRPSSKQTVKARTPERAKLAVESTGEVKLIPNGETIPINTIIKGEICYFV